MSIFQDVHTYLIISFVLMLGVLGKTICKRVTGSLSTDIRKLKSDIETLNQKKVEAEELIGHLAKDLETAKASIGKAVMAAESEAAAITKKASDEIDEIVRKKQKEYDNAVAKIRSGLSMELQHKIVDMTIKRIAGKLQDAAADRSIHSEIIEGSAQMLETLAEEIRHTDTKD
ncbi:MAG: hypothetical protein LBF56_02955 [Holosporales bacterium]|jgi:F0F1-type ATP synthase membrane subunit b/b'|nr:hypothetical protein [Holosporales bacterium]